MKYRGKEVITMQQFPSYELCQARLADVRRVAAEERLARDARPTDQSRQSARQTIGRSIIRIGEAVAAEPGFTPARSP
jgi:hypothetical protein